MSAIEGSNKGTVRLSEVTKKYGDLVAVDTVSLDIKAGEFFSLLGPSGCGKTTLLRTIAGFEKIDGGSLLIGGRDVTKISPQLRPTAMVFQNYALFPTMTVGENIEYGLQVMKLPKSERTQRVEGALKRVNLSGLGKKLVTQLSGGQQQRVALARAIAVEPTVILFDEPLSNLDVALREHTRRELKILQQELGTTSIYVTHDQQEALALSDRIAVMRNGSLQQVGSPEKLYREPRTAFVAQFLGGSNIVSDNKLVFQLTGEQAPDSDHVLSVRPEHVHLSKGDGVSFQLKSRSFLGTMSEWWIDIEGTQLRAWVSPDMEYTAELSASATEFRWVVAED